MKDPKTYLSIAKEDLKAAQILLKNNCFPQALFFTDQTVEKVCKYIILKDGVINEDELKKKIGHDSTKIFDILAKSVLAKNKCTENKSINQFYDLLNKGAENIIKLRNENRFKEYDEITLDIYMDQLYTNSTTNMKLNSEYDFLYNQTPEGFITLLETMNLIDEETFKQIKLRYENPLDKQRIHSEISAILSELPLYHIIIASTLVLASVFSSHTETSRYPSKKGEVKPTDLYHVETPIIKRLSIFHNYIEKTITDLDKLRI